MGIQRDLRITSAMRVAPESGSTERDTRDVAVIVMLVVVEIGIAQVTHSRALTSVWKFPLVKSTFTL
jgi:hypothetical protein